MRVLAYSPADCVAGELLRRALRSVKAAKNMEFQETVAGFSEALRQAPGETTVAVVLVADRRELLELLACREIFADLPMILVLPDGAEQTIGLGHRLNPRFVSFSHGERSHYADVLAVLVRMLERAEGGWEFGQATEGETRATACGRCS